jgi:hypothetical protein
MRRLRARKISLAHFENSSELCCCFVRSSAPCFSFSPLPFYVVAAGMATREAMEASKATSQTLESPLYHAPTLRPGLGAPRCPRCSAPLSKDLVSNQSMSILCCLQIYHMLYVAGHPCGCKLMKGQEEYPRIPTYDSIWFYIEEIQQEITSLLTWNL